MLDLSPAVVVEVIGDRAIFEVMSTSSSICQLIGSVRLLSLVKGNLANVFVAQGYFNWSMRGAMLSEWSER
jgi:putative heme iron utilization protein